jgi:perosamine synthetase
MSDMKSRTLAIFGGPKTINEKFPLYNSLGNEEVDAAKAVIESGVLSKYIGAWHPDFYGGPKVREFEAECAEFFGVKHVITVNSWTSGLVAAVGAIGIGPGDEVITTPWTMSATATAILHWNGIPVFADINRDTFNLDLVSVERNITEQTKAIISVDIFGMSSDMDEIMALAQKYNLKVISDTAQGPGAKYKEKYAGTLADIGGFSLNYHKHIHTGEGGILVTDDDVLAERMQLIRNHAEVVVEGKGVEDLTNMVGHNFRLGEIECAIGIEQLSKLPRLVKERQMLAQALTLELSDLPHLQTPIIAEGRDHAYYVYPLIVDVDGLGFSRDRLCDALEAEGLSVMRRYQNIHLLPMYQKKIAFGKLGFPWNSEFCKRDINYSRGICPVAEELNDHSFVGIGMCVYDLTVADINLIGETFKKVWANLDALSKPAI